MSPAFEAIVRQGQDVRASANIVYLACLLLIILLAFRLRPAWLCLLVITAIAVGAWWVADTFLMGWWNGVMAAQTTEADRRWVMDHDGGLLIPFFNDALKTAGCWIIGAVALAVVSRRARARRGC